MALSTMPTDRCRRTIHGAAHRPCVSLVYFVVSGAPAAHA